MEQALVIAEQPAGSRRGQRIDTRRRVRHPGKAVAAIGRAPEARVFRAQQHKPAVVKIGRDGDDLGHHVDAVDATPAAAAVG